MRRFSPLAVLTILLDILVLLVCLSHLPSVQDRARVPFEIREDQNRIVVSNILDDGAAGGMRIDDEITEWNSQPLTVSEFLEFAADLRPIGSSIAIGFKRDGRASSGIITLVPYYSSIRFPLITAFVGLAFWCIGVFVFASRPHDRVANVLHWSIVLMSATVFLTQGTIDSDSWYSLLRRSLLLAVYPLSAAAFLSFSTLFPRQKLERVRLKGGVIFGSCALVIAMAVSLFWRAASSGQHEDFERFQWSYDILHWFLLIIGIAVVISVLHSYQTASLKEERKKLQWILWGLGAGPTPFLFLIILPNLLFSFDPIPEEYATIFLIVFPFSLAISFLKYRILDIGVLINRSIVYVVLTLFLGVVFFVAVLLGVSAIQGSRISDDYLFIVALSLVVAILLNPLRHRLQRFVDETLFPATANYRKTVNEIATEFHKLLTIDELYKRVISLVMSKIPVATVGVYSYEPEYLQLQQTAGSTLIARFALSREHAKEVSFPVVYATPAAVSFRRPDLDLTKVNVLERLGISVCIPLLNESRDLLGMLVADPRSDTKRFDEGEVDLLILIGHQAEEMLARLRLQERMILEREGKRQAEELNQLKSYFVSSVSHELRTPLTSIRMFADTLKEGRVKKPSQHREYLNIIVGESERLTRLINNILDFSRIERGIKEYRFTDCNILDVVRKSVDAMRYQIEMEGGRLRLKIPKRLPIIHGDSDALQEVIMNLLSNAIKYSTTRKDIELTVTTKTGVITIAVGDKGIGIPQEDIPHIFEQFFRVKDNRSRQVGGAGLGLAVVKHIVEAHGGEISVQSKIGKGTTFRVQLPTRK